MYRRRMRDGTTMLPGKVGAEQSFYLLFTSAAER